jgi:hypothetical protein
MDHSHAAAKELARTAQTTAETYAVDNNGTYAGLTPKLERAIEPSIPIVPSRSHPYLAAAHGTADGYRVTVRAPDGTSFTIINENGVSTRVWKGHAGPACTSDGSATW